VGSTPLREALGGSSSKHRRLVESIWGFGVLFLLLLCVCVGVGVGGVVLCRCVCDLLIFLPFCPAAREAPFPRRIEVVTVVAKKKTTYEKALISLKIKKPVDAGVGRTFAVIIEGG